VPKSPKTGRFLVDFYLFHLPASVLGPGNAPILAVICPILTCFLGNCTVKHCNLPKSGRFLVDFYILVRKCILFKKWLVSIFILFL